MKQVSGDGGQLLDRFIVHMAKLWWRYDGLLSRFERFFGRWKRTASLGYEDPTEPLPVRGPCQVIVYGEPRLHWKLLAALAIGLVLGFMGGAMYGGSG